MLIDWADRSETALDAWSDQDAETRTELALQVIRANLTRYPKQPAPA